MNTDSKLPKVPTTLPATDRPDGVTTVVRVVAVAILAALAAGVAFYGFAFSAIVFIGCFFECTGANPLAGAAMALIPAVSIGGWVALLPWAQGRSRPSLRWFVRAAVPIWLIEVVVLSIAAVGNY